MKWNSVRKYLIVGGYRIQELQSYISAELAFLKDRIILVENKKYYEFGSGYSLYLGLNAALDAGAKELVFVEGDLYVDKVGFGVVCATGKNVITYNREPISADKSVAFYLNQQRDIMNLMPTVTTKEALIRELEELKEWKDRRGPVFLEIKVGLSSRENLGRPRESPIENKTQFMKKFLK